MKKYAYFSVMESHIQNMTRSQKEEYDGLRWCPGHTILVNLISERLNPHCSQVEQYVIEARPMSNSYSIEKRYHKRTEYGNQLIVEESGVLIPHVATFRDLYEAKLFTKEKYTDYFFNWDVLDIHDMNGCIEIKKYQFSRIMKYYNAGIIDLAFKALRS